MKKEKCNLTFQDFNSHRIWRTVGVKTAVTVSHCSGIPLPTVHPDMCVRECVS